MSSIECDLLVPCDPRWRALLERCPHEFYQTPEYARIEAGRVGGEAGGLWVREGAAEWLLPLVLRPIGEPWLEVTRGRGWDGISPYGYPHPLEYGPEEDRDAFVARALAAAEAQLRERGVVAVFVRFSPLQPVAEAYRRYGTVVEHGKTYWIDLLRSDEELRREMRKDHRYDVNLLRRRGATATVRPLAEGIDEFYSLYVGTMERVGAAAWYYFPRSYFEALTRELGSMFVLCEVREGGTLLASGLFSRGGKVAQYFLSGTNVAAGRAGSAKLMIVAARDWAKGSGLEVLHLGGGVGARDDALSQFKRGFTRCSSTFRTWRWVLDPERYEALVRAWEKAAGVPADPIDGYFPAYRKPISEGQVGGLAGVSGV